MTAFIAVDWGSTSFRAWSIRAGGQVLAESRSAEGMLHCAGSATGFAPVLQAHLAHLAAPADTPVLICGMAGARQGWIEAPYATLPAPVAALAGAAVRVPAEQTEGRDVRILPGLAQQIESDVMRGEETQLLGLALAGHQGLACMPGTHCKWAWMRDGAIAAFVTAMTGEMFALLKAHALIGQDMTGPVIAGDAFLAGV
ncbi:MAG TPA: 2-dehydro-3-deoxygalactonokinase, partial [Gemmobacter sp.]|nr:2-dehydro-3-deoxygalactonokinase [Gemmobacter sp.]